LIKVLVIDDSSLIRSLLTTILSSDPQIEVVGSAADPYIAREKIKALQPDVLTLDVEMPKMDGVTFLRNLMRLRPMPVVMVSTLTENGAGVTLEALELGAVDYVSKPKLNVKEEMHEYAEEIISKVKHAAGARIKTTCKLSPPNLSIEEIAKPRHFKTTDLIIAIGASTGGTEAIKDILCQLPASTPGIVISQHIPLAFSQAFAERIDQNSALSVCQAVDGQQILPGHAYLAPGDRHLEVVRDGARYICRLNDGPLVNRHKPSVEVMFKSVAKNVGSNSIGILLTGMGDDGSNAIGEIQDTGAPTIAQDEQTSVVWGMPGAAVKRGNIDEVLPLHNIAERILHYASSHG
jgi:two-component system, chemotaxis family, protein-glutamate methylesterase/glutaminase